MSSHVHSLKVGDKITVIGPKGKITYHGHGKFKVQGNENDIKAKTINMIAGGTGIAPMLQVARDILKSSDDQVGHLVARFCFLIILHLTFTIRYKK